jgi:DNA-binding PadR family transcriptional regulator
MRLLSRSEELVLLTAWKLQGDAYTIPIREELIRITGQDWSFGSIYDPLERLERKKLLESYVTEPTKERGGRSKRIYRLTRDGKKALLELRRIQEALWAEAARFDPAPKKTA